MVLGADYVQRGSLAPWTMSVALSYSLLIGNILLINGVPDAQADARVGKRTLAVRLGAARVAVVYGAWAGVSVAMLGWGAASGHLPTWCAWGVCSAPLSAWATWVLVQYARHQTPLRPALVATIAAAVLQGVALSVVALLV
jgi:1,4-dihydroxy-2-naphthoate octaprenyltransferase